MPGEQKLTKSLQNPVCTSTNYVQGTNVLLHLVIFLAGYVYNVLYEINTFVKVLVF